MARRSTRRCRREWHRSWLSQSISWASVHSPGFIDAPDYGASISLDEIDKRDQDGGNAAVAKGMGAPVETGQPHPPQREPDDAGYDAQHHAGDHAGQEFRAHG